MGRAAAISGLAVAVALGGCEDFEPFEPGRSDAPFRFFGSAAGDSSVFMTEVAVTDTTVRVQLRALDVERLTALAFELFMEDSVAVIDSVIPGDFFQPGTPIVLELKESPAAGPRWLGVVSLTDYSTDVSGGGVLASTVIRRITDEPFDVRFAFDTATTRLYGQAGQLIDGRAVGGRLVFDPSPTTTP